MKILLPINCSFNVKLYFSTNKAILIFKQPVVLNYGASVKAFKWNIGRQVCRAAHYIWYVDHAIDLCNTHTHEQKNVQGVKIFLTHANVCSFLCWLINRQLLEKDCKVDALMVYEEKTSTRQYYLLWNYTSCVHFWLDCDKWDLVCTYMKVKPN